MIIITGSGFKGTTSVEFGSASTTDFKVNDDKHITVISPAESSLDSSDKSVDVTVTTPNGTSQTSKADQFTYTPPPPPVVLGLDQSSGPATGGTTVTIAGSGFTKATSVSFGSAAPVSCGNHSTCVVNSDTQITVVSPAGSGTVDVTVTTLNGTSQTSKADKFAYTPVVSSVDPSSGPVIGGTNVTINGIGFTGATHITFGSAIATNVKVVSDKQITAVSPDGSGTVDVRVTTPNGTSQTNSTDQFTYVFPPVISSLNQTSGPEAGGTTVTINGTGFTGATSVTFGSVPGTKVHVVSDKQITVVSPAGSGTVDVRVTTPNGTSVKSKADQFMYTPPPPVVSKVDPSGGSSAGGISVTITGTGFTGATSIAFGSARIDCSSDSSCTINSDGTQITVISPAENSSDAPGKSVDVTVTTPNGTSRTSSADQFTYMVPPVISDIKPNDDGTTVKIIGTGFTSAISVAFGSATVDCKEGKACTINSDGTELTVTIPPEDKATGDPAKATETPNGDYIVDVTVTTPNGTSNADYYTYSVVG